SMATGTPVIALGEGGAVDSVIDGTTGVHVAPGTDEQIVAGFADAMSSFDPSSFDRTEIRVWAEGFSRANFRSRMQEVIDAAV
ncbi:MAG: glycosyltransferase, partial [Rhodococcus sp. (in: high G+C Gram-positive bacteria)]